MKNLIILMLLFISFKATSQMVVSDAGATANLATANVTMSSTLAKSSAQLVQLEKSYETLQRASDKIEKVNSMVKSVNNIGEIIDFQKEAISNINFIKMKIKGSKSENSILKNLSAVLATISGSVKDINNILRNGFFNMNDKERIDTFREKRSKILLNVVKTRVIANQYK